MASERKAPPPKVEPPPEDSSMARKRKAPPPKVEPPPEESSSSEEEDENGDGEEEEEDDEAEEEEEEDEEENVGEDEEEDESEEGDGDEVEEQSNDEEEPELVNKKEMAKNSKRNDLARKLLEPFGKDQLVDILMKAIAKNPKVVDKIHRLADKDPSQRKIFVRGLGWDATTEQVLSVFKKYGPIEECRLVTDRNTGRSKGYAFVLYMHRDAAQKAVKDPQKKVGSRTTACQLASDGPLPLKGAADTDRKIYVSNVPPEVNVDKLRNLFQKFGDLEEGPLGLDRVTGKPKGFAIFVYKTAEGAMRAMEEPYKLLEGHQLHCQKHGFKVTPGGVPMVPGTVTPQAIVPEVAGIVPAAGGFTPTGLQPHDLAFTHTSGSLLGLPNSLGHGVGQVVNPFLATANATGFGISPRVNPVLPTGMLMGGAATLGGLYGGQQEVNNFSPNVTNIYSSQAALQGLNPYQSSTQPGQAGATRTQPGVGSLGAYSSYTGR